MPTREVPQRAGSPLDLSEVARTLKQQFWTEQPVGYLPGKTKMRDRIMESLQCSALEAEELVDSLQARGFIRYSDDPKLAGGGSGQWTIGEPDASDI